MGKKIAGASIRNLFCGRSTRPLFKQSPQSQGFWTELCKEIEVPDNVAKEWWARINTHYSQPHRFFHNEKAMFLTHKLPFLKGIKDPAVALACIFQYFEYRPKTDLSQENCLLFKEFASEGLSQNQALKSKVLRLLGAQQEEGDLPEDEFNQFQDLDLAVLGSHAEEYGNYRDLLRKEFPESDDESYRKMRLKVLKSFLLIPTIYCSEAFAHLEFTARANIEKEIEELTK